MIIIDSYDKILFVSLGGQVNSYYQSFMQMIQKKMDQGKYEEVLEQINEELALPYVPKDIEERLVTYVLECKQHIVYPVKQPQLEKLIHGSMAEQEKAVSILKGLNLRQLHHEVQTVLDSDNLLNEIKGELIEALMDQKIDEPYKINKNGLEITFIPSAIVPYEEDETVKEANAYFDQWFSNDNPTFLEFCSRLLRQEVLEMRPFDCTDIDAKAIAKTIVRLVSEAFGQSEEFALFVKQKKLENIAEIPLLIERRGDTYGK